MDDDNVNDEEESSSLSQFGKIIPLLSQYSKVPTALFKRSNMIFVCFHSKGLSTKMHMYGS